LNYQDIEIVRKYTIGFMSSKTKIKHHPLVYFSTAQHIDVCHAEIEDQFSCKKLDAIGE